MQLSPLSLPSMSKRGRGVAYSPRGIPIPTYGQRSKGELKQARWRDRQMVAATRRVEQRMVQQMVARTRELKGLDTQLTTSNVPATTNTNGAAFVLNLIRPGAGSYNREGRKVKLKSVRLKGVCTYQYTQDGTSGDINGNVLRMVVVWDKQPSGTLPTFDTIFGSTDQAGTEDSSFMDSLRYDNTGRFRVLRDYIQYGVPMIQVSGGTTNEVDVHFPFDEYVECKGCETVYSGDSSPQTIADISSGALYVFFRALSDSGTTNWLIQNISVARLRYTDG